LNVRPAAERASALFFLLFMLATYFLLQALFYAPAGHVPSADFIESLRFTPTGFLRKYYTEKPQAIAGKAGGSSKEEKFDAVVWAAAFHDFELEEYEQNPTSTDGEGGAAAIKKQKKAGKDGADGAEEEEEEEENYGGLCDLGDPDLSSKRVKRMPKWAKSCLLQYALPLGLVFFLFLITYLFVLYGPMSKLGLDKFITPPPGLKSAEREALERAAAAHEEAPTISISGAYNPHYGEEL
jgi:hypothetical protein